MSMPLPVPLDDPPVPDVDTARSARPTAARPPTPSLPSARRRARRGSTTFWVVSAVIVTVGVVGVVSISALLVRASFAEQALRAELRGLSEAHQGLVREVVTLSAPSRIAAWARGEGMVVADDVVVLRVRAREPRA
jgi:cell division protein FtsB